MNIDKTLKDINKFLIWQRHQIIESFKQDNPEYKDRNLFFNSNDENLLVDFNSLYNIDTEEVSKVDLEKLYKLEFDLNFEIS